MNDETRPMKRSEILAVENAKRIATQLREERNDAVALAQERREQAQSAITLCRKLMDGCDPETLRPEIDALEAALRQSV